MSDSIKVFDQFARLLLEDDTSDTVMFTFESRESKQPPLKVKGHKSILKKVSPVFQTMFNKQWNQSEAAMNDPVDFNQHQIFRIFMEIIYELRTVNQLSVEEATNVFFYAHKYQIEKLVNELKNHLNRRMDLGMSLEPYSLIELEQSIKMAELYSLDHFKRRLDDVKLSISDQNALKFYELCIVSNMDKLLFQIAEYLKTKPIHESWPFDLIKRVFDRNRQEITQLEQEKVQQQKLCQTLTSEAAKNQPRIDNHDRINAELEKFKTHVKKRGANCNSWDYSSKDHIWYCKSSHYNNTQPVIDCLECKNKFNIN